MTKETSTKGNSPAETDDARSAETSEAKENRDALADQAEKGLHKAMKSVGKPED